MAASREQISNWLDRMYEDEDATHMLVVCDTWDWDDYPVFVTKGQDVHTVAETYRYNSNNKLMEVYSRNHSKQDQLKAHRAFNYD